MPRRFCAICGKALTEKSPHFGMCIDCYMKENPLFELPVTYKLKICPDCYRYTKRDEWIKPNENEFLSIIKGAIHNTLLKSIDKNEILTFSIDHDRNNFEFSSKDLITSLELKIKGVLIENPSIYSMKTVKLNIDYELCENCLNLRSGTYFKSILQLRVDSSSHFEMLKDILNKIHNLVKERFDEDDRQYISKIVNQKNGVDVYLSTNELMNHIISYLRSRYHFLLKRSKKLIGRDSQRGKGIYRLKTLIKFLSIKKKDIIEINNQKFIVEQILKNKVILKSKNNEKLVKDYNFFFKG
ncbi:MAG: hypothetical protein EU550_03965 [Promethearchaeota archaeon]|nr:MAG: hypothetical protein EU550_03965 [Candidatus Lokiarchaeota archaeon]